MSNFRAFAAAVATHFAFLMSKEELYQTDITVDEVWAKYLASFPPGTNPIYRTRTEHDGSYDRSFVRKLGNVVAIKNGALVSIWDAPKLEYPYDEVSKQLSDLVKSHPIADLYRTKEAKIGVVSNVELRADKTTHQWHHFNADIAVRHRAADVGTVVGEARTTIQVMRRGLEEIKPAVVDDVLELIATNALYRGDEFKRGLVEFRTLQAAFSAETSHGRSILLWQNRLSPAARLRNTVIGTLLTDLSEGVPLDGAVRSYELKVAPASYKRPTALVTESMIKQALTTIADMGLESALERRHARIDDITVNNVRWVDNQVQPKMKGGLAGLLLSEVKAKPVSDLKATDISIGDFMALLPEAIGLELFFAGSLQSNLMSLTAPVHADAKPLFKWDNSFAWSYAGNITDSIKEKVKAAGGNTNAVLRVSLAWYNGDDLDIHAECPDGHVFFANKSGILDVDMNAGGSHSRSPVENLSWVRPKDGRYQIGVNQYNRRETIDVGFTLELESAGKVTQFSYPKAVSGTIHAIEFDLKNQQVLNLKISDKIISGQGISLEKWGLSTEQFVKVSTVLNSPNHWDGNKTGNLHTFFILEGCRNDEPVRGIYNEFLKPELEPHRKVLEVLGNKTKCPVVPDQLSGLGFSSTKQDMVVARVTTAASTRVYQIQFGLAQSASIAA